MVPIGGLMVYYLLLLYNKDRYPALCLQKYNVYVIDGEGTMRNQFKAKRKELMSVRMKDSTDNPTNPLTKKRRTFTSARHHFPA
jgi:hypothetical protein